MDAKRPPLGEVLGTGALTGFIAAFAAGMIDAVWSWAPAAQFLPHAAGRLRFVLYTALSHGAVGALAGLAIAVGALVLSRGTRLGDLVRFAFADHAARRAPRVTDPDAGDASSREEDPKITVVGLSLVLAGLPMLALALWIGYRLTLPYLANRHA